MTNEKENARPNGAEGTEQGAGSLRFTRIQQYQDWVRARIGDPTAMCAVWTDHMVKEFPELRRVRGHAHTADGKARAHWWCVTPGGEVVDPTVAQYGSCGGVVDYEQHDESTPEPVGKCIECGGYVFAPRNTSCSETCDRALELEYNGYLTAKQRERV